MISVSVRFWNIGPVRFSVFRLIVKTLYSTDFSGTPWLILIDYFSSVWFSVYHDFSGTLNRLLWKISIWPFIFKNARLCVLKLKGDIFQQFLNSVRHQQFLFSSLLFDAVKHFENHGDSTLFFKASLAHHHKKRPTSSRCIFYCQNWEITKAQCLKIT